MVCVEVSWQYREGRGLDAVVCQSCLFSKKLFRIASRYSLSCRWTYRTVIPVLVCQLLNARLARTWVHITWTNCQFSQEYRGRGNLIAFYGLYAPFLRSGRQDMNPRSLALHKGLKGS